MRNDLILLDSGEIHLWIANLVEQENYCEEYAGWLTNNEKKRAKRFVYPYLQNRFIVCRSILRQILHRYLFHSINNTDFGYETYGKPFLKFNPTQLHFNVSHSQGMVIFGITRGMSLGVDLEQLQSNILKDGIEENVLSKSEMKIFNLLDEKEKSESFFNAWTRKEAILKAMGLGIAKHLREVEVSFKLKENARVLSIMGDSIIADQWLLKSVKIWDTYIGAIAIQNKNAHLKIIPFLQKE